MSRAKPTQAVKPGDVIVTEAHHVGESRRSGEILDVLGEPGHQHYRVRWEDGHETIVYPSSDTSIHRPAART